MQSRVAAAYRAFPAARATILAHMAMNRGANARTRAAGMGSWQGKTRPLVKLTGTGLVVKQPADEMAGTGLVAKTAGRRSGRHRPCSKQPADEVAGTLPCNEEVGGGSAVVLATRKAGSDLPYCLPPNLSPLPVSVHTHSLSLLKNQI